jgi:mycothiol synthase
VRHLAFEPEPAFDDGPLDPDLGSWAREVADEATPPDELTGLLRRIAERAQSAGSTALTFEAEPADAALDQLVRSAGFETTRTTLQLRRSLPIPDDRRGRRSRGKAPVFRPFRPDHDEASWLDVNRRAFAWHPEQGRWTLSDLAEREREPWFRPEGFLVHDADPQAHRVDGFCWTQIHTDEEPPLGEIYVIGVDPDAHGQGLGRALVLAGLDWLTDAGLAIAMLYVESDNEPALRLYHDLGFVEHLAHRWWRRDLEPPTSNL